MSDSGTPVKCNNCGLQLNVLLLWFGANDNPGGIVMNEYTQYYCPKCGSNWWEVIKESE